MTRIAILITLLLTTLSGAQNPCEWAADVKDSIGEYRATKDYLMYERDFAGNSSHIYFSVAQTDGMPTLNMTMVSKSADFIKAHCLDKNSRLYFQLNNGKIVTLMHVDEESCGSSVRVSEKNHRILNGYFMFLKDSYEELKKSPVSLMRIKFSTETVDYVIRETLTSSVENKTYEPALYMMNVLECLER